MSASLRMRVGIVAAGLSCLFMGYALAQQQQNDLPRAPERPGARQTDRPATQQPYTAQFRGTQRATAGQSEEIERYLANCLLNKNQSEIEISQFAQQQAQNPEVKQFAQEMVKEHQQLSQKLQPLAGMQAAAGRTSQPLVAGGQNDAERQAGETTRLPGSPAAGQPPRPGETATTPGTAREANQSLTATEPAGQQSGALNQLKEIDRQITDRVTQAVREQLQEKSGAEFDQSYLGYQIGSHTHMLAALEVIEQEAQGQLKQIAQQTRPAVQEHLDHSKQLMKDQEQRGRAGTAERQPSRTQR